MFCIKCGNKLPDESKFCDKCGNPVSEDPTPANHNTSYTSSPSKFDGIMYKIKELYNKIIGKDFHYTAEKQEYHKYPHPYHNLGGWLAFIAYGQLVGVVLIVLTSVFGFFVAFQYLEYLPSEIFLSFWWLRLVALITISGLILQCIISFTLFKMIKEKNSKFLRFYEISMLTPVVFSAIAAVLSIFNIQNVSEFIKIFIQCIFAFAIWGTYFKKSVRVRTYFGSDEYLRRSIFFKNAPSPIPADMHPYQDFYQNNSNNSDNNTEKPINLNKSSDICHNYGKPYLEDEKFCSNCGTKRE
ncbi:zinc-ribbon domain-containing protein [Peptoanaerobacter stomatis]